MAATAPRPPLLHVQGDCSPTRWRRDAVHAPDRAAGPRGAFGQDGKQDGKQRRARPGDVRAPAASRSPGPHSDQGATPPRTVPAMRGAPAAAGDAPATPQECATMIEAVEAAAGAAEAAATPGARPEACSERCVGPREGACYLFAACCLPGSRCCTLPSPHA